MRRDEGSAILIVVVFLLLFMPLALILTALAQRWQRQATTFRDTIGAEFLAEGGISHAELRLSEGETRLAPGDNRRFSVDVASRTANVRIDRHEDAVLSLGGELLTGLDRNKADLETLGLDGSMRQVYQFRKIEVYSIASQVDLGAGERVSAHAVLVRPPGQAFQRIGALVGRGFFSGTDASKPPLLLNRPLPSPEN